MKLFIIEYYTAYGQIGDCYSDFCYSREEAERIAPIFMKELDWAASWQIREDDTDTD